MPREYYLPERGLVSAAAQSMIQAPHVPRARFQDQTEFLDTFDAGYLVPMVCEEILPGDHVRIGFHAYVRASTPLFPLFSRQRLDMHFFFVPNRLVDSNWVKLMGQQDNPGDSIAFTVPQMTSTGNGFAVGGVGDHFGLPTVGQCAAPLSVNVYPFRGYNLIYNQWYRDENSMAGTSVSTLATEANVPLKRRAKTHDMFTAALPAPQKFTPPAVLGTQAPVTGLGIPLLTGAGGAVNVLQTPTTANPTGAATYTLSVDPTAPFYMNVVLNGTPEAVPQVFADLSSITVNTLRQSFMVQALLERDARGGTRYTEIMKSHFGVTSPDARLQRTEFIGGGSIPISTTPIAQTAPTTGVPLGALGGATSAFGQAGITYAATEHGYLIGIGSVKTEVSYSQGVRRHWSRSTRLDFYWPSLAGMGEQAILRKEIYATGVPANDDVVFGYTPRYEEYRQRVSDVRGLFRPTAAGSIPQWHLSQQFTAAPVLGETFLVDNPPMTRVLAAGAAANGMQFLINAVVDWDFTRAVPAFGTPALLGRF